MIVHKQFFGDAEREFALPFPMIRELQRERGAGIGALAQRIVSGGHSLDDLLETIRLALIGGGADPQDALALVKAYVEPRPLVEAWALAIAIMDATLNGVTPAEQEAA